MISLHGSAYLQLFSSMWIYTSNYWWMTSHQLHYLPLFPHNTHTTEWICVNIWMHSSQWFHNVLIILSREFYTCSCPDERFPRLQWLITIYITQWKLAGKILCKKMVIGQLRVKFHMVWLFKCRRYLELLNTFEI